MNPMLQCLECGKDLGDLMRLVDGLRQFCLCPDCFDQVMGHLYEETETYEEELAHVAS